ncbi:hypothetical protein Micbo1qcDRAFT_179284 [Microdochium bolleyi]|uniref:F-box domain-containing protein n=1 Tax=Microdochium bolleyi TaxID=196109 RepID=A0A136IQ43_9PEZI|nr:hypothetical protein Micbo1qcDRAFT_179284 [Microdochium bolleyi]
MGTPLSIMMRAPQQQPEDLPTSSATGNGNGEAPGGETQTAPILRLPQEMVLKVCRNLSLEDQSRLMRTCRSFATGIGQQNLYIDDIASGRNDALRWAIANASMTVFDETMYYGVDLSAPCSKLSKDYGDGLNLTVTRRPLAVAIATDQYDFAIFLIRQHAQLLCLDKWAEDIVITFSESSVYRSEMPLFTCFLYAYHQDTEAPSFELLRARERFIDVLLEYIVPGVSGCRGVWTDYDLSLATATAVPYAIWTRILTGTINSTRTSSNFVAGIGAHDVTFWEQLVFNDATVQDHEFAVMAHQGLKLRELVFLLPKDQAATIWDRLVLLIIDFVLEPEGYLEQNPDEVETRNQNIVRASEFTLLSQHLAVILGNHRSALNMRWMNSPDTLLQHAARQARLDNPVVTPNQAHNCTAEAFFVQYPHDIRAVSRNRMALTVCELLLRAGASPVSTASYEANSRPSVLLNLVQGHDRAAPLVRKILRSRQHVRPRNGGHVGDLDAETGDTALHVACRAAYPSVAVIRELLSHGFHIELKNKDGETPIDVLLAQRHHAKQTKTAIWGALRGR